MNNKGLIIFDLDDTILDSMQLHATVFAQILREQNGIAEEISRLAYYHMFGRPVMSRLFVTETLQPLSKRGWSKLE